MATTALWSITETLISICNTGHSLALTQLWNIKSCLFRQGRAINRETILLSIKKIYRTAHTEDTKQVFSSEDGRHKIGWIACQLTDAEFKRLHFSDVILCNKNDTRLKNANIAINFLHCMHARWLCEEILFELSITRLAVPSPRHPSLGLEYNKSP